jgi:CRISPR-associated protein Cas2
MLRGNSPKNSIPAFVTLIIRNRANQYRILWVFVSFDLPTETKRDKRNYALFRKGLLRDGFTMLQYSTYIRHCNSRENAAVHIKRAKRKMPPKGQIIIYTLTDRQFGDIQFFYGAAPQNRPDTPQQLELFD